MQIVEVKNDIAKISYNSVNNHLLPSDFLLIEDNFLKFIAQVISIETTNDSVLNNANLRLCLFIDSEDNLSFYNGYIIGKNAKVNYISAEEIVELISDEKENLYFGNLVNNQDVFVKINSSFVDEKLYIQSDKKDKIKTIVQNLAFQLVAKDKKVVIIDFDNQYRNLEKAVTLKINQDIKLPLNVQALDNLIEKDIEDCPIEDRAFIQGIILELRDYIKTIPDKFLQFSLFRDVINAQYQENPISGLMILRNKLWLYAQNNLFADDISNFENINSVISENNYVIIDASDVDEKWHNFVVQTLKDTISEYCYLFLNFDDVETNKKFVNEIYSSENIIPIVSSSYSNPCRNLLGLLSANQILCKAINKIDENIQYIEYLNKLNQEEFIVFGEATLYLPLIISIQQFDSSTFNSVLEHDIKRDVDKLLSNNSSQIPQSVEIVDVKEEPEVVQIPEEVSGLDDLLEQDFEELEQDIIENDVVQQQELTQEQEVNDNEQEEEIVQEEIIQEQEISQDVLPEESVQENIEASQTVQDDVYDDDLDFLDEILAEGENISEVNEQVENLEDVSVVEQVDEVVLPIEDDVISIEQDTENMTEDVTTIENDELFNEDDNQVAVQNIVEEPEQTIPQETIELIDDLPSSDVEDIEQIEVEDTQEVEYIEDEEEVEYIEDDDLTTEEEYVEEEYVEEEYVEEDEEPIEINENISEKENPNLPVYETDINAKVNKEDLPFDVGDRVYHPKHGKGIVQGFTNYSDKKLFCQIEFENVGRRILDPFLAKLEKV